MLNEGTTIVMDRYAYSGVAYSAAKVKIILWKSDNFQCVLADTFEGSPLTKTVPVNFDTFRLINFNKCLDIEFAINISFGVIKVTLSRDNTKLTYIVSALIN